MTIDKPSQKEINSEKASLYSVFQQLMAIVQFLAQLFRSSDDKYIGHKNGNFRDLVESLAKFVSVMQENIWRIQIDEIHDHYFRKAHSERTHFVDGK